MKAPIEAGADFTAATAPAKAFVTSMV